MLRNRLKRQLRALIYSDATRLPAGVDLVIVLHPAKTPIRSSRLEREMKLLCQKNPVLSSRLS